MNYWDFRVNLKLLEHREQGHQIMTYFFFMGLDNGGMDWLVIHDQHILLASALESELFVSTF